MTMWLASPAFDDSTVRTMRVDYYHTGNATAEVFSLDAVKLEGTWPGRLDRLIDDTNLGKYLFEVHDQKTGRLLYSRGFASIYGEWEETDEAKQMRRTFSESVRFPAPLKPFQLVLKKRDEKNTFREIWSIVIDPQGEFVDHSDPPTVASVWAVMQNGPPSEKVDLLLLGDGYNRGEMDKWHADAKRLTEILFSQPPFREHRSAFNVWAIDTPAEESGVSIPSDNVWRHSPLGATYDAFGSERYVLTFDNKRLRDIAAAAPYEFMEIVVNDRKYGGGGIFNLYATVAADNSSTPYVFVHEFGHHFAGLADEYYTSDVAYTKDEVHPEPWEPNATVDPQAGKWKDLIEPGTPLPTPWAKDEFEAFEKKIQAERHEIRAQHRAEGEMEALFASELARTAPLLARPPYGNKVGAFEGADYQAHGYYRPESDCMMFTRNAKRGFCAVCRRAIDRIIEMYSK